MDKIKKQLGLKIKNIRTINGLTQEGFCNRVGIESPTLSNIENGKSFPLVPTLIRIIEEFKVEPNELFSFIQFSPNSVDMIDIQMREYSKKLPSELKTYFLEIMKIIGK